MDKFAMTQDGELVSADAVGHLPANLPEVVGFAFTTAPEGYDYWYVATAARFEARGKSWRLVAFTDEKRFADFQRPRYSSGLHPSFLSTDEEECSYHELPSVEQLMEAS